jgi:CarD family transcriptional regulator
VRTVFAKGDMAVYPAHGVGVITSIETQTVAGVDQTFYVLQILDNRMTIMIPTQSSKHAGLRSIVSKKEVDEVISILEDRDLAVGPQTWNRRYRDYMDKIKTGSIHDVAEVMRDLFLLSVDKDLSYGERKMLDTARNLLVKELSLAQQVDEEKISKRIDTILS